MAEPAKTIALDFESRLDLLEAVQALVDRTAAAAGLDEDAVHDVSVSIRECLVNAIKHGNKQDRSKRVFLTMTLRADSLEAEIRDQGGGFDPEAVPDATAPENVLSTAGRGLFFMRAFMSEVHYSFPQGGGTIVRLVKNLDKASAGATH